MPGRARHHQFELAAELEQRRHAAEQDREGQTCSATAGVRNSGELRHEGRRRPLGVAGAAHQLDEIQRVDQREDGRRTPPGSS